jgi:hypothetical protein
MRNRAAVVGLIAIVAGGVVAGFAGVAGRAGVAGVAGLAGDATAGHANTDRAAVERAASDYAEALYNVEPFRIEQSVHPELVKRGFFLDGEGQWAENIMTYQQLYELAGEWNADGSVSAETSPWRVTVLEVLDQTATARVTAQWGIDHMQLARYDGKWKIVHVLWQQGTFN